MNIFKAIFGAIWGVWTFFWIAFTFFICGISTLFLVLIKKLTKSKKDLFWLPSPASKFIQFITGIKAIVLDEQNLDHQKQSIYIINHQSMLDPFLTANLLPSNTKVLAKKEFEKYPFINIVLKEYGIAVSRSDKADAKNSMKLMADVILENGYNINIYPEGTRDRKKIGFLKFKTGAFRLSVASGIPIVPIVVQNIADNHHPKFPFFFPGKVKVKVLKPIYPEQMDFVQLTEKVEKLMLSSYLKISEKQN